MRRLVALLLLLACGDATTPAAPGRTDPNAVHVAGDGFRDGMGR